MPRARRSGVPKHESAIPLQKSRSDQDDDDFAMDAEMDGGAGGDAAEMMEGEETIEEDSLGGQLGGTAAGATSTAQEVTATRTKKDKKKSKHDALMQRLIQSSIQVSPYSKSHNRRMKRKAKQSMGLDSMTAALDEAVPVETPAGTAVATSSSRTTSTAGSASRPTTAASSATVAPAAASQNPAVPGRIGSEARTKGLSSKQRQKMLSQEKNRLPAVLAHKSFAASPFETIRLHAQNTVVPLAPTKKAKK